jgi:hypothetical protein
MGIRIDVLNSFFVHASFFSCYHSPLRFSKNSPYCKLTLGWAPRGTCKTFLKNASLHVITRRVLAPTLSLLGPPLWHLIDLLRCQKDEARPSPKYSLVLLSAHDRILTAPIGHLGAGARIFLSTRREPPYRQSRGGSGRAV